MVFAWTDERVDTLKKLHAEGVKYDVIGQRFGVDRHSITGKCSRLGLKRRSFGCKGDPSRVKRELGMVAGSARNTTQQANGALKAIRRMISPTADGPEVRELAHETGTISILDLEEHHCRFTADGATFCGTDKADNHPSYCSKHAARCGGRMLALVRS